VARNLTHSAQVSVLHRGEPIADGAVGVTSLGTAPSSATSYFWSCATKPLEAIVVGMLVDEGRLDVEATVRTFVPELPARFSDVTLRALLTHTAPVPDVGADRYCVLDGLEVSTGNRAEVFDAISRGPVDLEVAGGTCAAYSVFANWFLVAEVIERVLGTTVQGVVADRVLRSLGVRAWLELSADSLAALDRAPFALLVSDSDGRPDDPLALLSGRAAHVYMPGGSGVGPVSTLVAVLEAVRTDASSRGSRRLLSADTAGQLVRRHRSGLWDKVRENDLGWGLGFTVDGRAFSHRLSESTFGHLGWDASCIAFADPDAEVVAAVAFDRQVTPFDAVLRQAAVLGALVADLEDASLL
jgi:CubicO group peptidase (beta-lactamase class C family)